MSEEDWIAQIEIQDEYIKVLKKQQEAAVDKAKALEKEVEELKEGLTEILEVMPERVKLPLVVQIKELVLKLLNPKT